MAVTLDKKAYPLMMHLSNRPECDTEMDEVVNYDPATQTSTIQGMAGSWCSRSNSTAGFLIGNDNDSQEDD
jgi:hypothetical protein